MVEVAADAQPSAVQRSRSPMPPADSTEGCAAPTQSPQPVKREFREGATSSMPTPRGKGRKGSPPRDVRILDASHEVERRAHWAPTGEMVGSLFRQTDGVNYVLDSGSTS